MSKFLTLGLTAATLILSANSAQDRFVKYKSLEAYEVRPGILMMPRYTADGRVCEIGLEKLHYSPEIIRLDSNISEEEVNQIFDELVPPDERGPKAKDQVGDLITLAGQSLTTLVDYEKVSIQIHGKRLSNDRRKGIVVDQVAATLKWKDRPCR